MTERPETIGHVKDSSPSETQEDRLTKAQASQADTPVKAEAIRGFGYAYLRGRTWWIRYSHRGRDIRESAHSQRLVDAERRLKDRWKQMGRGRRFIGPAEERVRVDHLLDALVVSYENNGRRSLNTLKGRLKPLRAAFGDRRAVDVTGAMIERYKQDRLSEKTRRGEPVAAATVNRELAALRRAYRIGIEQERIAQTPVIKPLAEHNARQGFVEPPTFEAITAHLPEPLNDVARFAYASGWRKSEVLTLNWSDVDLEARRITLRREHSKNEEPRLLVLTGDLLAVIERRWAARPYESPQGPALSAFVFHRMGHRIVDFRDAWARACQAGNRPGLLFHDLRRSAIRNMDRAGVSQAVAMRISGHKTVSVYQRYRIVDEQDIARALEQTQAANRQAPGGNLADLDKARKAREARA